LSLPVGTLLAWTLVRSDLPGRRMALTLMGTLLFIPLYLQAAAWQGWVGLQGWCIVAFGVPDWLAPWLGAVWVHSLAALPWVVLIVGAGFWLVEPELEEQALLDASPGQVFLRVTLPSALAALGVAALWVLVVTAGEMTVTDLFGVRTYAEEVYTQFAGAPEPDEGPLGVLPGVYVTAALVLAGLAVCARLAPGDRPISFRQRPVFRLGRWWWPTAIFVAAVLLVLVGLPLGNLCYKAGLLVTLTETGRLRTWSVWKCLTIIAASPGRHPREFGWSLGIGALAATAALAAGTVLAWVARRSRVRGLLVLTGAAICLAVPGPVLGIAVIWLLNRPGWPVLNFLYDQSIFAPWLVLFLRGLPPAMLIMVHALRTVPQEMMDCAAVDGAGPLVRLFRIALPCRVPALALAWLAAFAVALADLAASILVVPPGMPTLSIRIFGLLHSGVEDRVAGICLAQAALFAVLGTGMAWLARRWQREPARQESGP